MEAGEPEPKREHTGGVLGIFFGLAILVGSLGLLVSMGLLSLAGKVFDGSEKLAELVGENQVPFGLELTEAAMLPSQEIVLKLARAAEPDAAAIDPADESPPVEVVIVQYPSPAAVAPLFESGMERNPFGPPQPDQSSEGASRTLMVWEKDPTFAWHTTIERDEILWSRWRARYIVERAFREGGGWQDSVRVNLSQPGRNLVLFAQWPDETTMSKKNLGRLLRSIEMLETEES